MSREYFTETANEEKLSDLLNGYGSKSWTGLNEKQALLIDITVTIINNFEPILDKYDGFLEKRKSKSWFKKHQDEVFLSFFCAIANNLRAWHHIDDSLDEQIRNRFPLTHDGFYLRNWQVTNEDLHYRNFFLRIGKAWDQSLRESGVKVKEPVALVAPVWFMNYMRVMLGWLEEMSKFGYNGSEMKYANLLKYFAD